jgi:hypothetical protein
VVVASSFFTMMMKKPVRAIAIRAQSELASNRDGPLCATERLCVGEC